MKLSCPACGALFSLDALLGNEGAREAVMAAMQLPAPLGWQMIRYVALFRPAQRQLSLDRVANLINELLPMILQAKIERNGRLWNAPLDYWKMGIEDMLAKRDTLALPLKSHGYLLTIIEGYNIKAESKKETQREDRLAGRTPVGRTDYATSIAPGGVVPPHSKPEKPRSVMPDSVRNFLPKHQCNETKPPT